MSDGFINANELKISVSVDSFESEMTGIPGNVDGMYNKLFDVMAPGLIDLYNSEIGELISDLVLPPLNDILNNLTLGDIIDDTPISSTCNTAPN